MSARPRPSRIGVFLCHCGKNIARTVDIPALLEELSQDPDVVLVTDHLYFCSDPGQLMIRERIRELELTAVVVAACTPTLHTRTFRRAVGQGGLDPYQLEIANIREQCAWVHPDREEATRKAAALIRSAIEKARRLVPLEPISVPITRRAVVIGGGVAGIQAALEIADGGYEVVLVERAPSIGGRMAQLSETFPTLDCSSCILTPKMVEANQHPRITIHALSEVTGVEGSVGNFKVTITGHPRFVTPDCTGCGDCVPVCPQVGPNRFDEGLGSQKAIYIPFPQAVPFRYTIDREMCLNKEALIVCDACHQVCEPRAIDFDQQAVEQVVEAGAIVIATGYDPMPLDHFGEYGYDRHPDVIDGLMFERLLSASGPTAGQIRRPSDGRVPRSIGFVQCAGSRDPARGVPYCSRICCMYTAKHAFLYREAVPEGRAHVFYIDIRAGGKGHEEFIERVREEAGVTYVRGRVSRIYPENGQLVMEGVDTLLGEQVRLTVDMVVLATAMLPAEGAAGLAGSLRVAQDADGFFREAHPKLRPVECSTAGVFLAGVAQAPRDISDTVAGAGGAASKVLSLFAQEELVREPFVAVVADALCRGCEFCVSVCPYGAIEVVDRKAGVNQAICAGCGACLPACLPGALQLAGHTDEQLLAQIKSVARS